jgi:hypothetical protein
MSLHLIMTIRKILNSGIFATGTPKSLPWLLTITHLKGHQDDKIAYDDLPLPAQLNIGAGILAIHELTEYQTTYNLVHLLSVAIVQFSICGHMVTRQLAATIRQHQGLRLLKKDMMYD